MSKLPFLSEAWMARVREIKATHLGDVTDQPGLTVNATVTQVPFGDGELALWSSHGPVFGWQPGHLVQADITLRIAYDVARDLVLDTTRNRLELALAADEIEVLDGFDALRDWWGSRVGDPASDALEAEVRALTA